MRTPRLITCCFQNFHFNLWDLQDFFVHFSFQLSHGLIEDLLQIHRVRISFSSTTTRLSSSHSCCGCYCTSTPTILRQFHNPKHRSSSMRSSPQNHQISTSSPQAVTSTAAAAAAAAEHLSSVSYLLLQQPTTIQNKKTLISPTPTTTITKNKTQTPAAKQTGTEHQKKKGRDRRERRMDVLPQIQIKMATLSRMPCRCQS
jgi:hypothetical protein